MQKIIITGNLGADPVVKSFDNGGKVANFNVGVTERGYKTQSGVEVPEHTEWFRCVVKQSGEKGMCNVVEQYLKKGNKVGIVGKIKTREYEDKGEKKSITELIVEELELLTPKLQGDGQPQQKVENTSAPAETKNDDLPF
jgi:single-strand DNA-binding protein